MGRQKIGFQAGRIRILMLALRRLAGTMTNKVKIGTHNGAFHCDEVLACSMLKQLPEYSDAEIVRTRDQGVLDGCDIVVDVGAVYDHSKRRYDHHQKTFSDSMKTLVNGKTWETKLSSAGLVYVHYGREVLASILQTKDQELLDKMYDKIYEKFVEEVDANDNGIATHDGPPRYAVTTTLASRVAGLRPAWNDPHQDFDAGFYKAMDMVSKEFEDRVRFFAEVWWPARRVVAEAMEGRFKVHESGQILAFDNGCCPYKEHVDDLEAEQGITGQILFTLFEDSTNKTWRVGTLPVHPGSFECRRTLRNEWKALRDTDLDAKSGIEGCVFVHAAGFIGGHKNREGALQMAIKSLDK